MQLKKLFVFLLLLPSFANAMEDKTARANVANELAVCAAYFFIGSEAAKKSGDTALAANIQSTADSALATSIKLSDEKTAVATLKIALNDHQQLIRNDSANIGILIKKYKSFCMSLASNPDNRYDYWLKK